MKYAEKWGDSVDIAVELALADLKLKRDQVEVKILEEPSKGFFGIGSKLAKVRVEEIDVAKAPKETPKETRREEPKKEAEKKSDIKPERVERRVEIKREGNQEILIEVCGLDEPDQPRAPYRFQREKRVREKPRRESAREGKRNYGEARILNERPADLTEQENHPARTFLQDVTEKMGLDVSIKVSANEEMLYVDIEGPDSGTIIGKRGQTLDAIQYLTSLVVNKEKDGYTRVVIDAEGYRRKRELTLEKLANRLADKAQKSGRSIRLEPMNPYERKVIHTALQSRPEVTTKSEGEEPYRRVIIEPQK
ncbi:MAG: protein jag [Eubacteriales bacterium]|jgi:spoIIIJ-associated protein|nr:protein jag [Eubacteriales bacterium]